jgi:hypothetical protein
VRNHQTAAREYELHTEDLATFEPLRLHSSSRLPAMP